MSIRSLVPAPSDYNFSERQLTFLLQAHQSLASITPAPTAESSPVKMKKVKASSKPVVEKKKRAKRGAEENVERSSKRLRQEEEEEENRRVEEESSESSDPPRETTSSEDETPAESKEWVEPSHLFKHYETLKSTVSSAWNDFLKLHQVYNELNTTLRKVTRQKNVEGRQRVIEDMEKWTQRSRRVREEFEQSQDHVQGGQIAPTL